MLAQLQLSSSAPSFAILRNAFYLFVQIFMTSLFIAICAQISIPLYFTPVPLSGQTFGIMLVSATMGWRMGVYSVLAYLAEGIMGLPVLAGGASGLIHFFGPTGGYLVGFVVLAFLVGFLTEQMNTFSVTKSLVILLSSSLIHLGLGASWLAWFVGVENAFMLGVAPFVFGAVVKSFIIVSYMKNNHKKHCLNQ